MTLIEQCPWLKDVTLADKQWGDEGRVVFAGITGYPFVAMMILGGCRKNLFSYWYLREDKKVVVEKVFKGISRHGKELFIDSGVFTFFKKMKMPGVGKKLYENSSEVMARIQGEGVKRFGEFLDYTKNYVKFLNRWDDYITWAFEMDIDMFSNVESADRLYRYMKKNYKSPQKILRVWHYDRPFSDWQAWCDSGEHAYLAVEGGGTHGHNPDFYRRFVDYAHKKNVKVHILATTGAQFLSQVDCDTADSSTWSTGGRHGAIYSPVGILNFGRGTSYNRESTYNRRRWAKLSEDQKKRALVWLKEGGLEMITPEMLGADGISGVFARNLCNIYWFRRMSNRPVDAHSNSVRRFSILDNMERLKKTGAGRRSATRRVKDGNRANR